MGKMKKMVGWVLFLLGFHAGALAVVDPYDTTVVRSILDEVGWSEVPLDSVIQGAVDTLIVSMVPARVTSLNLSYRRGMPRRITALPETVRKLPELFSLKLNDNELTTLPAAVTTLHNLARLDLSGNRLDSIPEALIGLPLQILYCDGNLITALPEWIDTLARLGTLLLNSNRISTLPTSLTAMANLRIGLSGNKLCTVDSMTARWLDTHHITPDWRAAQECGEVSSVFSELVTRTVVMLSTGVDTLADKCQPLQLSPEDTADFGWFTRQRVLKAVTIRENSCFSIGQNTMIISFTWDDVSPALKADDTVSVYFVKDSAAQYLEGSVDTARKTISVRTSRAGTYLLVTNPPVAVAHPVSRTTGSKFSSPVRFTMAGDMLTLTAELARPSMIRVRLFSLDGRILHATGLRSAGGVQRIRIDCTRLSSAVFVATVQSGEFNETRILSRR